MGWAGTKNGVLLQNAAERGFAALITADQGIEYQQNIATLPCPVIILRAPRTRLQDLISLVPRVVALVEGGLENRVYSVAA